MLLLLNPFSLSAQDMLKDQLNYAEKFFSEKKYFDAITEYKRLQFFDSLNQYSFVSKCKIAESYKGGGKYTDAIKYFRLAITETESKEDIFNLRTWIVRCNILRRTTEQALVELDQMEEQHKNKKKEINYWRGWTYILEDNWALAAHYFNETETNHPLKFFCDSVENEKYSILFPKLISYILPGAGQFYTGEYLSGLMSLGWNALFMYLSVNSFNAERIFDGLITTALFFRFHRGNVQNAEKFAIEKNRKISNEALLYLQNNYKGLKP